MGNPVICIGSVLIDELYFCSDIARLGTSNPSYMQKNIGGVISNIAQHLVLLEENVILFSALGTDKDGDWILKQFSTMGIDMTHSIKTSVNTGKYVSILNPDGSLFTAACADLCTANLTTTYLESKTTWLKNSRIIISDTNIEIESLIWIISFSRQNNIPLIIDPVSVIKAQKIKSIEVNGLFMVTPNEDELISMCIGQHSSEKEAVGELLNRGIQYVWVRKGKKGSSLYYEKEVLHLPSFEIQVKDSTGAGDAALAGWVFKHLNKGSLLQSLQAGHALALEILQTFGTVDHTIHAENFNKIIEKYYPNE